MPTLDRISDVCFSPTNSAAELFPPIFCEIGVICGHSVLIDGEKAPPAEDAEGRRRMGIEMAFFGIVPAVHTGVEICISALRKPKSRIPQGVGRARRSSCRIVAAVGLPYGTAASYLPTKSPIRGSSRNAAGKSKFASKADSTKAFHRRTFAGEEGVGTVQDPCDNPPDGLTVANGHVRSDAMDE
jgi:hypothetical protein